MISLPGELLSEEGWDQVVDVVNKDAEPKRPSSFEEGLLLSHSIVGVFRSFTPNISD